ncbi:MAG: type ISP restriction/modification enzyme [Methylococcaceae bacterium]
MTTAIETYLNAIHAQLKTGNATEHTHRPALQNLLNTLLPNYRITNEPRRIACGSPDFEIALNDEPIAHIEAKDIGIDLNKAQKSEQLQRYLPALNNLVLTDYLEFRWFVNAEYKQEFSVKLAEFKNGQLKTHPENFNRFEQLIKALIETPIITLKSPEELAKKMAHIAGQMKYSIHLAYQDEDDNGKIHQQLNSFREVLIDTLSITEFADMVAQTICYGLFSAKCSAINEPFSRLTAVHFVPKTNPFLRQFFNQLAGIDLDERLIWMVEHLVAVLNRSDISAILANFGKRTRQEDPVVHFYETFLANYDAKLREVRGVYYTPEPVVSYIVRSVDLILKNQFKLINGLANNSKINDNTHKVQILDPATGTGTFLYAVITQIYQQVNKKIGGGWSDYVSQHLLPRLHGFELLMAAYTVAHIKLSLQLKDYGYDFKSNERLRVFLTNTLDEAHGKQSTLLAQWLSDEANSANSIKRDTPVMVILGNPPYSYASMNNEKWISELITDYYKVDNQPLNEKNSKGLQDDYVKFIRFAQWRIMQTGYGVLAVVTNHGYLDNPTFRGMRQSLLNDFDEIYILDLHGNAKKKETSPDGSLDKNVFDIQQGVAIGIFIKKGVQALLAQAGKACTPKIFHAHCYGERKAKYQYLAENDSNTTQWTQLKPQAPFYLFIPQNTELLPEYERSWKMTEMMPINSTGIKTHRDHFVFDLDKTVLEKRLNDFRNLELSDNEISERYDLKDTSSFNLSKSRKALANNKNWQKNFIKCLYRPFDVRHYYHDKYVVDRSRDEIMQHMLFKDNIVISLGRQGIAVNDAIWHLITCSSYAVDTNIFRRGGNCLFPLYIYPTEKTSLFDLDHETRQANFSAEFIADLETKLQLTFIHEAKGDFVKTISALDVFYYMYAVFHSPSYRTRYAEFLKIDFPRLPISRNKDLFKSLSLLGEQLVELHLMNSHCENDCSFPIAGDNLVEKIVYKEQRIYINKTQYFDKVSAELWGFYIGGYQVCQKWLKDRKDKVLSYDDLNQYLAILAALEKTQALMIQIDSIIRFPIIN